MDRLMYINSEVESIDVGFTMKIFKSIHVVQSHHIHVIIIYGFSKNKNKPKTKTPKMQDMKFIDDLNTTNLNSKIYKIIRVNPIKRVFLSNNAFDHLFTTYRDKTRHSYSAFNYKKVQPYTCSWEYLLYLIPVVNNLPVHLIHKVGSQTVYSNSNIKYIEYHTIDFSI